MSLLERPIRCTELEDTFKECKLNELGRSNYNKHKLALK